MKKIHNSKKATPYKIDEKLSKVEEPQPIYTKPLKGLAPLKNFTFDEFKKIADKVSFTQAEWALILHISERTLQRYAKGHGNFASINAERAMQLDKVLNEGKITFGSTDNFYKWIKSNPYMLEGSLSFNSLTTYDGIEKTLTQLGRIQHGILA